MFADIYRDKRVFISGASGFKGSWLTLWLYTLGAKICAYSLEPETKPSLYKELSLENKITENIYADILDSERLDLEMRKFKPDIVFHLAAQPFVRKSYKEPVLTYKTNVIGTLNMLEAARKTESVKAFINVTTDKCYENNNSGKSYDENSPLGGYDMYSSSKACSEILSSSYRRSFLNDKNSYLLSTVRAGNVIGGGDYGEDRLIPDIIRAVSNNKIMEIRSPNSVRPWQYVLDALSGYLLLGQYLLQGKTDTAQAFNFGPDSANNPAVGELVNLFLKSFPQLKVKYGAVEGPYESKLLNLNTQKAKEMLGWCSSLGINDTVDMTANWYSRFLIKDTDMFEFSIKQIKEFEGKIKWEVI